MAQPPPLACLAVAPPTASPSWLPQREFSPQGAGSSGSDAEDYAPHAAKRRRHSAPAKRVCFRDQAGEGGDIAEVGSGTRSAP